MALPSPPNDYGLPIPNNSFSSPETYYVAGPQGCLIVGTGLYVDFTAGILNSSGGGGGGAVAAIAAGPGIAISSPTGNVTICNNGVVNLTGTLPVVIGGTPGSPNVALAPSGVAPGTYSVPTIDVDTYGRILNVSSGSLPLATTTVAGIVRLATVPEVQAGTDNATAITPLGACATYIPRACIAAKGSLIAGIAAASPTALPVGTDGQVLTADSTCLTGLKWSTASGVTQILAGTNISVSPISGTGVVTINSAGGGGAVPATPLVEGIMYGCTAFGIGGNRVALGYEAFCSGGGGVALGTYALANAIPGTINLALGASMPFLTNGNGNIAIGGALENVCTDGYGCGSCNIGIGDFVGLGLTSQCYNVLIGYGIDLPDLSFNISCKGVNTQLAIGSSNITNCCDICSVPVPYWLTGCENGNIRPGAAILDANNSPGLNGYDCTMALVSSDQDLVTNPGTTNVFTGRRVCWVAVAPKNASSFRAGGVYGYTDSTGIVNLGYCAGKDGGSGIQTIVIGNRAANCGVHNWSVIIGGLAAGATALSSPTHCCNTVIGYAAGFGGCSCCTVAIGHSALNTAINGGGGSNGGNPREGVYVGMCSGYSVQSGRGNTAVGAGSQCYSGFAGGGGSASQQVTGNTSLGYNSLRNTCMGCFHTAIGACALTACQITGANNVALGYCSGSDALCTISTESNHVILGNNNTTCIIGKVPFVSASDLRWKKVAGGVPLALPFVESLSPIKYQFCDKETGEVTDDRYRYGFSAQEILANEEKPEHPIIVGIDNPDMYTVSETMLFPVLVNAIKELSAQNKKLEERLAKLEEK